MILRRALLRHSRLYAPSRNFSPSAVVSQQAPPEGGWLADEPVSQISSAVPEGGWLSQMEPASKPSQEPVLKRGSEPFEPQPIDAQRPFTAQDDYERFKQFRETGAKLGSRVGRHYQPHRLVTAPPQARNITLELLLASGAHLGHATSIWNPGNQRYILGVRQGIHIISLETTAALLRRAAKVVEGVSQNGGLILFVGNRPGQDRCVVEAAKNAGGCHLFNKWVPGTITNGRRIVGHGQVIKKDFADRSDPDAGLVEDPAPLRPDLVVCLNPLENYILLHECGLYGIPTIGIIDTDADPTWVTYPIPANDDSLRCVQLIAGVLGKAGETGRLARIREIHNAERRRSLQQPQ